MFNGSKEERLREMCAIGNLDDVMMYINSGVDINSQNSMNGWTPLHWASKRGNTSIVEYLIFKNADVNITNHAGQTPAQLAYNSNISLLLTSSLNQDVEKDKENKSKFESLKTIEIENNSNNPSTTFQTPIINHRNKEFKNETVIKLEEKLQEIIIFKNDFKKETAFGAIYISLSKTLNEAFNQINTEIEGFPNTPTRIGKVTETLIFPFSSKQYHLKLSNVITKSTLGLCVYFD